MNDAQVTEPSHHAMLRTPSAPMQPGDGDLRVGERLAHLGAEARVDELGVLVDEHERLEVLERGRLVEDQVVGAEDRARGAVGEHGRAPGSATASIPGLAKRS